MTYHDYTDKRASRSGIAATDIHWQPGKECNYLFFNDARRRTPWKLIVDKSVVGSKLLYGLETVEVSPALITKLETFQIKGLRKILHMSRPFIGWSNANAEVYRCAMEAVNGRENSAPSLLWQLQKHLPENRH